MAMARGVDGTEQRGAARGGRVRQWRCCSTMAAVGVSGMGWRCAALCGVTWRGVWLGVGRDVLRRRLCSAVAVTTGDDGGAADDGRVSFRALWEKENSCIAKCAPLQCILRPVCTAMYPPQKNVLYGTLPHAHLPKLDGDGRGAGGRRGTTLRDERRLAVARLAGYGWRWAAIHGAGWRCAALALAGGHGQCRWLGGADSC